MKEIVINDKQKYLSKNYPFTNYPLLTDKRRCLHCERVFIVSDYKVYREMDGTEYMKCPNAPECDGSVIDWIEL